MLDHNGTLAMTREFVPLSCAAPKRLSYVVPTFGDLWQPKITFLPNGWGIALADIGPPLAEKMMEYNEDNQRKKKGMAIQRFTNDMTSDEWYLTHQGIAFNERGRLHDGQNRLEAVIKSGKIIQSFVWFGAGDKDEMKNFDNGTIRQVLDAARIFEYEVNKVTCSTITTALLYARSNRNYGKQVRSHAQLLELIEKYSQSATIVGGWFKNPQTKGVTRSAVRAAVFAAFNAGIDPLVLERFVSILCEHYPPELGDNAANKLRQYIGRSVKGGGQSVDADVYLKTCAAIRATVDGHDIQMLRPCLVSPWVLEENAKEASDE